MPNPTKQELEAQAQQLAAKLSQWKDQATKLQESLLRLGETQVDSKSKLKAEIQILKLQLAEIESQIQNKA